MNLTNVLLIIGAAGVLLIFWIVAGIRHLSELKRAITEQWEMVDELLRKRQDLVPNLIETIRRFGDVGEDLIERVIRERRHSALHYGPGSKKIELEHDLSKSINELFDLRKSVEGLGGDTNFLELKTEIDDLEKELEQRSKKYNEMVRYYNKHRKNLVLRPLAVIFSYKTMNIFEVET